MKTRPLIQNLVVFFIGFSIAWISKRPAGMFEEYQTIDRASQQRIHTTKKYAVKSSLSNTQVEILLEKIADSGFDEESRRLGMTKMETSELVGLIAVISQRGGVTGLNEDSLRLLDQLLTVWFDRDTEAVLAWVDATNNLEDREHFLGILIDHIVDKDFAKATMVAMKYCRDANGNWKLPWKYNEVLFTRDVEQMLKNVPTFVHRGATSTGSLKYPHQYDFHKALDGLANIQSSLRKDESLSYIPNNLLGEWAESDPEAAWNWLSEGKDVKFNNIDSYIDGYASVAPISKVVNLLIQADDIYRESDQYFNMVTRVIGDRGNSELLRQYLAAMPRDRLGTVTALFEKLNDRTGRYAGGTYDIMKSSLLSHLSSVERISVFADVKKNGFSDYERKFYTPILRVLGHDEAEIQQMIPLHE